MTATRLFSRIAALAMALVLAACAAPGNQPGAMQIRQGKIEQITPTTIASSHHTGIGAVLGGLAGVGIGSLIGGGTGRDVAMVVGAIGGTMAGSEVARRYDTPIAGQEIFVRTDSGVLIEVTQPVTPGLRVGQRVFIQGNGVDARVTPQ
ncbi:glycine zipper 2TM domain-containing protein [Variovorax sp. J22P168]|uniref:glycine zipper 2TM domain-containing protein n=1 Tax=Variovorax jilinensis TaxID=3053513 RepID=UPI0025776463|nr:glycine zipper 2TM domain-containing protein [Variovorax sp. J22P168]MDM0011306.1 glycine zipper 2TM domain-containing protein [Variovorax sp. J22P168]